VEARRTSKVKRKYPRKGVCHKAKPDLTFIYPFHHFQWGLKEKQHMALVPKDILV
jgi:hypothetical protein